MRKCIFSLLMSVGLFILATTGASGKNNDLTLTKFRGNEAMFRAFLGEFGTIFTPRIMAPAETLGHSGFEVGTGFTMHKINSDAGFWQVATQNKPSDVLFTPQFFFRKGLPFSFELGALINYLADSDMMSLGFIVRWAYQEGFIYVPDMSVTLGVHRLIGAPDLDLITGNLDFSFSKCFGINGIFSITPYLGYSLIYIRGASHVLDATPGIDAKKVEVESSGRDVSDYYNNFITAVENVWRHRVFFGARFLVTMVSISLEFALTVPQEENSLLFQMGLKVAADF